MIEQLREKAGKLPLLPGVYIMKDAGGNVIYVGKAVKLKNRVSSYFHGAHNAKTELMVSKVSDFDVIIAGSEFEALVLENSLIKHHMPKYNILLKDDKGYPFVRLDAASEYPRFTVASKKADDGAMYFGPFGGRGTTYAAIDAVCKALKLPTCSRKFPRDIGKERPCLNHHLGACRAYCLRDTPHSDYQNAIKDAILIFEGKADSLLETLSAHMEEAAGRLQFELAAEYRDRIRAIETLKIKQRVLSQRVADTDVIGYFRGEAKSCFVVLRYIDGSLLDKEYMLLETPLEDDSEAVEALLRQFYGQTGTEIPRHVHLPCAIPDIESMAKLLTESAGRPVEVTVPQRGEKAKLVLSACANAREEVERATTGEERVAKTAEWLQKALGLPAPPQRIEAFDISNTGSSDIVASMTVFLRGRPLKRDYRKFKIKTIAEQNDYASMAEVVSRRLQRYLDGDEKFCPLPDILFIDGGAAHAAAALEAANMLGVTVPVFGMVKDDRHRTRALVTPEGREIGIDAFPAVFAFIGRIQEETHRFAIEYHHSSHRKSAYASELDSIKGVGPKRHKDLLKAFGSVKAIKNAGVEELQKVVPAPAAAEIWAHYHNNGGENV